MRTAILLLLCSLLITLSSQQSQAQRSPEQKLDLLTTETQYLDTANDKMLMLWWIPNTFWELSLAMDGSMGAEEIAEFMETLKPYIIVAVLDGNMSALGAVKYQEYNDIQQNIFILSGEEKVAALDRNKEKIDPSVSMLLEIFKPILTNMLGPMGSNMNFYLFPAELEGKLIVNEKKEDLFTIQYKEYRQEWELPFEAMLPLKACGQCDKKLSGRYNYCPYDGKKLVSKKELIPVALPKK